MQQWERQSAIIWRLSPAGTNEAPGGVGQSPWLSKPTGLDLISSDPEIVVGQAIGKDQQPRSG